MSKRLMAVPFSVHLSFRTNVRKHRRTSFVLLLAVWALHVLIAYCMPTPPVTKTAAADLKRRIEQREAEDRLEERVGDCMDPDKVLLLRYENSRVKVPYHSWYKRGHEPGVDIAVKSKRQKTHGGTDVAKSQEVTIMPRAAWLDVKKLGRPKQSGTGYFAGVSTNRAVELKGRLRPSEIKGEKEQPRPSEIKGEKEQPCQVISSVQDINGVLLSDIKVVWKPLDDISVSHGVWFQVGDKTKILFVPFEPLETSGINEVTFTARNEFKVLLRLMETGQLSTVITAHEKWTIEVKNKHGEVLTTTDGVNIYMIGDERLVAGEPAISSTIFYPLSLTSLLSHINESKCKLSVFVHDDDVEHILSRSVRIYVEGLCNETYRKLLMISNFNISSFITTANRLPFETHNKNNGGYIRVSMTVKVAPKQVFDNRVHRSCTAFEVDVDHSIKWILNPGQSETVLKGTRKRFVSVFELM
eukprot:GHVS01084057.1.p1 GENE.GHVS01084057.1~~GHVS01084057.1.p1  ORF type:complete len:470 (-),score=35.93 GHVS01084057.1:113-1522(-)